MVGRAYLPDNKKHYECVFMKLAIDLSQVASADLEKKQPGISFFSLWYLTQSQQTPRFEQVVAVQIQLILFSSCLQSII